MRCSQILRTRPGAASDPIRHTGGYWPATVIRSINSDGT